MKQNFCLLFELVLDEMFRSMVTLVQQNLEDLFSREEWVFKYEGAQKSWNCEIFDEKQGASRVYDSGVILSTDLWRIDIL